MPFSKDLADFIHARGDGPEAFLFGLWLHSLDTASFNRLAQLVQMWLQESGSHELDDLLTLALMAYAAELQCEIDMDEKSAAHLMEHCCVLIKLESLCRRAWLVIERPLSIRPECNPVVTITDEGMKARDQMQSALH